MQANNETPFRYDQLFGELTDHEAAVAPEFAANPLAILEGNLYFLYEKTITGTTGNCFGGANNRFSFEGSVGSFLDDVNKATELGEIYPPLSKQELSVAARALWQTVKDKSPKDIPNPHYPGVEDW